MTRNPEAEQPPTGKSAAHWPEILASRRVDAAALLAGQQQVIEGWVAGTQRFLEGMQELFKRQILLQTALLEQAFASTASFAQVAAAKGSADDIAGAAQAAMQKTVEALRNATDAACRCSMDALAVFRERMEGGAGPGSRACEKEETLPTTAEVVAAQARSGRRRRSDGPQGPVTPDARREAS